MKRVLTLIAAIFVSLSLGAQERTLVKDIAYKTDQNEYVQQKCRIDVDYEKGAEGRPVIVWFHGGGLTSGQKQGIKELTPTIDYLAPLLYVRGDAAPMLVISGDREMELYGRYEENAYFVRMLRLNGHKDVAFYEVDGFNHVDMAIPAHELLLKYMRQRK